MVRIFWSAIALLVAATAAVVFMPQRAPKQAETTTTSAVTAPRQAAPQTEPQTEPQPEPQPEPRPTPTANPQADAQTEQNQIKEPAPSPTPKPEPKPEPEAKPEPKPEPAQPQPDPSIFSTNMPNPDEPETLDQSNTISGPGSPTTAPSAPQTEPTDTQPQPEPEPQPEPQPDPEPTTAPAPEPTTAPAPEPAPEPTPEPAPEPTPEPTPQIAVTPKPTQPTNQPTNPTTNTPKRPEPVVKTPTGLLLDGRWNLEGSGTPQSPYTIEWDMLVALQRDYQPRLGKTEIPEWIAELNGKTVTIRGYALLPMGMSSTKELLVMLNQWDSCCIGVPPTPFDAIEVRLAKNLSPQAQSMFSHTGALSFGDLTGTFKIDPYIVQGYLLGLYLMEDASANLLGPAGTP